MFCWETPVDVTLICVTRHNITADHKLYIEDEHAVANCLAKSRWAESFSQSQLVDFESVNHRTNLYGADKYFFLFLNKCEQNLYRPREKLIIE